jgi:hypothetical protein
MKPALLAALAVVTLGSACSSSSSGPGVTQIGTYTLVSVNGAPVPAVTQSDATIKTEVLSGTLVVNSDDTFNESRQGRITLSGGTPSLITATQSGTWSTSGTQLSFVAGTALNPVNFTGTYVSGTLTYTSGSTTFLYQQQSSNY